MRAIVIVVTVAGCGGSPTTVVAPPSTAVVVEAPPAPAIVVEPSLAVPALYAPLFRAGTTLTYQVTFDDSRDGAGGPMVCTVDAVTPGRHATTARVTCLDPRGLPRSPAEGWPGGVYLATAHELYRGDLAPTPEALIITVDAPAGDDAQHCHVEDRGPRHRVQCFRPGAGLVRGELADAVRRARYTLVDLAPPADPAPLPTIAIDEVSAADDWFAVVNVGLDPVALDTLVFTDHDGDRARAAPLDPIVLASGERHVQSVSDQRHGFQIGRDESITLMRASDYAVLERFDPGVRRDPANRGAHH